MGSTSFIFIKDCKKEGMEMGHINLGEREFPNMVKNMGKAPASADLSAENA